MSILASPSRVNGISHEHLPAWKTNGVLSSPLDSAESSQQHTPTSIVDPRIDDKPQLDSKTEWWYFQSHLTNEISEDPSHTVIVCVFRHLFDGAKNDHTWAVIYAALDWKTQKYTTYSKVPYGLTSNIAKMMETSHPLLSSIIKDLVNTGPDGKDAPFHPDKLLSKPVAIRQSEGPAIQLDWDDGAFIVGENGCYHLKVPELELDIRLRATRPLMLHGYDGVTVKDNKVCITSYNSRPSYLYTSSPCFITAGLALQWWESTREPR